MPEPTHFPRPATVALQVRPAGSAMLEYSFATTQEAAAMVAFLREFLPDAQYVIQPVQH